MWQRQRTEVFRTRKEMGGVSPYISSIRDWKTCQMLRGYLEAYDRFKRQYEKASPPSVIPFREIEQISSQLYALKEEHHLVFRRVVGPERIKQEDRHKLEPNDSEIRFIANVGMLFHKILVARELKYISMHYDPLSGTGSNAEAELVRYLEQINELFDRGIEVIIDFIRNHAGNVLILAYLLENSKSVKQILGKTGVEILKLVTGQSNLSPVYYLISRYYVESGWYDRAEKLLRKILRSNPKHREARELLDEVRVRTMALKPRGSNNHQFA